MKKSIVLSATFPSSKTGAAGLEKALAILEPYNLPVIEYYVEDCGADQARALLEGRESIFLSGALQKQKGLNPSSLDPAQRKTAVELLVESMRFAEQAGAKSVLVNSGPRPSDEKKDEQCLAYLMESLCQLHYAVKGLGILLEPGDREVEYHHLIGHTPVATQFIQDARRGIPDIGIVFDTSHIPQLGEELYTAWEIAKQVCTHVHLANCSLVAGSPYYGDKHPPFGIPDGIYSHEDMLRFYNFLGEGDPSMTSGIEIILQGNSEKDFFERIARETQWFFVKQ